jgi:flagellar biosynthesis protein FlhG
MGSSMTRYNGVFYKISDLLSLLCCNNLYNRGISTRIYIVKQVARLLLISRQEIINMRTDRQNKTELEKIKNEGLGLFLRDIHLETDFQKKLNLGMLLGTGNGLIQACQDGQSFRPEKIEDYTMSKHQPYESIVSHGLDQMQSSFEKDTFRKKIIAVAGAKGGVGKSVFATNLAVYLSMKGFRTVIIDLDLGGANVHLYLGKNFLLTQNINDFLKKRVRTLNEIEVKSEYGPYLIGGSSSELGTANIEFMKKMRLIRAIGNIDADYIILDLSGDMSLNSLDFYLQADYGIVVTTPESASYMSSYHFIKEALYRKLRRLFGPESKFRNERDSDLEKYINKMTQASDTLKINTIEGLMEKIKERKPQSFPLIKKALDEIHPCLILNKVPQFSNNVHHVPSMIQEVSKRWLSKEVAYLGEISAQIEIEASVLDQVPVIARYPQGRMAMEMENIVNNLLYK